MQSSTDQCVSWCHLYLKAAGRYLRINHHSCSGEICVLSEGDKLSNYCKSTGDFYQRQTTGYNVKYLTEVMLTMSFLYGAKDKLSSFMRQIILHPNDHTVFTLQEIMVFQESFHLF